MTMPHPDEQWLEAPPWTWPDDPEDYEDYMLLDGPPEPEIELDEWRRGRCFNCGAWARQVADGEFECECGDACNIYEPPPEIP